jgi:hypothetical protein
MASVLGKIAKMRSAQRRSKPARTVCGSTADGMATIPEA